MAQRQWHSAHTDGGLHEFLQRIHDHSCRLLLSHHAQQGGEHAAYTRIGFEQPVVIAGSHIELDRQRIKKLQQAHPRIQQTLPTHGIDFHARLQQTAEQRIEQRRLTAVYAQQRASNAQGRRRGLARRGGTGNHQPPLSLPGRQEEEVRHAACHSDPARIEGRTTSHEIVGCTARTPGTPAAALHDKRIAIERSFIQPVLPRTAAGIVLAGRNYGRGPPQRRQISNLLQLALLPEHIADIDGCQADHSNHQP